jgi:TolB protein
MKFITRLLILSLLLISTQSHSQSAPDTVYIKVGDAKIRKSLMALPPFQFQGVPAQNPNFRSIGQELFNVFYNDLDVSAYFQFINQAAFLEDTQKIGLKPAPGEPGGFNFENWKKIGAEFLVRAAYRIQGKDLFLEAYVYQIAQAKVVLAKTYKGTTGDARIMAHTFANDLVFAMTGKPGYFTTKIVISTDRAGGKSKEIYAMDWDSANAQRITFTRNISISPNWSPDGNTIVYTTYTYHKNAKLVNTDLLSYDLKNKKRFLLSWKNGINSGATFSPDGKSIYLTNSNNDNHDIFKIDADGKNRVQITKSRLGQLNVEPSVSPDGKLIAYSSDRDGKPMIYTMNVDGSGAKRITFAGNYNSSPNWSPDGKKIVFSGQDGSHFDIFVMNADGTGLERLTSANKKDGKPATNEYPNFSPDGRQVIFISNRTGNNQLYIINIDGTNERRLTFDQYNYYSPKWLWK